MNVFVTGATGVLGTTVTRLLIDSGHNVRALARNSANTTRLREAGAQPIQASLFDPSSLMSATRGCQAVLHLATRIPPASEARRRRSWQENDRIRMEGTRNLVHAALECGVTTFIYPGIVFVYRGKGAEWIDVSSPLDSTPILDSSLKAEAEVERFTRASGGNRGIILRMGGFYGPAASSTRGMLQAARRGFATILGPAKAYQPLIWVDDAALAVIDALSQAPAGTYNIVDDEPLPRGQLVSLLAETVGRKWLFRPPTFLLRFLLGKDFMFLARSQRVSNRRFKDATNWSPMISSARDGFRLLAIPP